jgi:hypothetical protein
MDQLDYSLSRPMVGALIGMTGIGGGSLMPPVLILIFGVHLETAVGTDLLYASATKTVGTSVHSIARSVDWQIVSRLATGSIPTTVLAIYGLAMLGPESHETGGLITGCPWRSPVLHRHLPALPRDHPQVLRRPYRGARPAAQPVGLRLPPGLCSASGGDLIGRLWRPWRDRTPDGAHRGL